MLFRDFEDVMTWVLTLALTGLALVGAYFILVEIVTIVREIARQIAIASQGRNPGEIAVPPEKRVKPYRDRRTVNRLIKHLTEGEETPETPAKTEK